jgi:hypothetical protein
MQKSHRILGFGGDYSDGERNKVYHSTKLHWSTVVPVVSTFKNLETEAGWNEPSWTDVSINIDLIGTQRTVGIVGARLFLKPSQGVRFSPHPGKKQNVN